MWQSFSSVFPITNNKKLFEDRILPIFADKFHNFHKKNFNCGRGQIIRQKENFRIKFPNSAKITDLIIFKNANIEKWEGKVKERK